MWSCTLTVLLATGLAWFNPITADVNSTLAMEAGKYLCAQGARINCTDTLTEPPQLGHFSKCPEMFRDYCIEGECRFIQSEQQPSCVCKFGFVGSRCQLVDMFYLTGKQDKFIIVGLILTMLVLIALIIIICICAHRFCRKHKARRKQGEEVEALSSKPLGGKDLRGEDEDTPMTTLA
ncbi:probetacellulin-like isoform X1 [Scyliorhinus canicula]|uniref:probetacellulin-like isoform X1 n=1 Tax=Scyliorhinus canicula TaxID=7830 RepID=UPI0018F49F3E|nr:probetacellulin-like isoform X1 [Scyliorhinus canicula]